MTIETKFNLGDEAYILYNDKVHKVVITGIEVYSEKVGDVVTNYKIRFEAGGEYKAAEVRLFGTKLSLLNSL